MLGPVQPLVHVLVGFGPSVSLLARSVQRATESKTLTSPGNRLDSRFPMLVGMVRMYVVLPLVMDITDLEAVEMISLNILFEKYGTESHDSGT